MLKITIVDVFLRVIPEAFLFISSGYLLSSKKMNKIACTMSVILISILVYLVRELPIHYGVHIIINIAIFALAMVFINKIDAIKAVTCSLGFMMLLSICEWINLLFLDTLVKHNLQRVLQNSLTKDLYFLPSLILFILVVLLVNFMIKKKDVCI